MVIIDLVDITIDKSKLIFHVIFNYFLFNHHSLILYFRQIKHKGQYKTNILISLFLLMENGRKKEKEKEKSATETSNPKTVGI